MININEMLGKALGQRTKPRKLSVGQAYDLLIAQESDALLDQEQVQQDAVRAVENDGIVFLDEIDKICARSEAGRIGADVSREGVQRDLLPLLEGTTVSTKYGPVKTDHVLFIASGAFHMDATTQSPDRRANSSASARRNGRRRSRSVSSLTIPHAGALCAVLDHLQVLPDIRRGLLRTGFGLDGDVRAPVAFGCELHAAVRQRKQRMVCAYPDIGAGMPLGATLTRQDVAGEHELTPVFFDPEPAARCIAPVARGATRLLVCHGFLR